MMYIKHVISDGHVVLHEATRVIFISKKRAKALEIEHEEEPGSQRVGVSIIEPDGFTRELSEEGVVFVMNSEGDTIDRFDVEQ